MFTMKKSINLSRKSSRTEERRLIIRDMLPTLPLCFETKKKKSVRLRKASIKMEVHHKKDKNNSYHPKTNRK